MPNPLDAYTQKTVNWRMNLRQNTHRTYFIIFMFMLIYASIGMLVDLYMATGQYDAPLSVLFYALITFKILPLATLIMMLVAGVSLLVTYAFYDKLMLLGTDYHEITRDSRANIMEQKLYNIVEELKIAAGLQYMPRVFIINADYMNAFASGYSEKSAMVAITRGLMEKLNREELQAVMAHEVSHIRHLDIKVTLTASLLANLSIMVLDVLFYTAIFSGRRERERGGLFAIIMLLRFLLPVISVLLLLYLSRTRELMADAGCVELMRDNQPLAQALIKISHDYQTNQDQYSHSQTATPHEQVRREAYIFDPTQAGIHHLTSVNDFFSTHPSLETRLAAIGFKKN